MSMTVGLRKENENEEGTVYIAHFEGVLKFTICWLCSEIMHIITKCMIWTGRTLCISGTPQNTQYMQWWLIGWKCTIGGMWFGWVGLVAFSPLILWTCITVCPFLTQEEQACPLWCGEQHCSHMPWDIYYLAMWCNLLAGGFPRSTWELCQPSIPGMLIQKHPSALSGATQESVPDSLRPNMEKQHYRARLHPCVDDKISSCVSMKWSQRPW